MTDVPAISPGKPGDRRTESVIARELTAGATAGAALLPSAIAAGVIAFSPLGPEHATAGLAAALVAVILGGLVTALWATSSFIVSFPLPNMAAVLASLGVTLLATPAFAEQPALLVPAYAACVLITGLAIVMVGVAGLGRIIKFTPHPVMAGFKNGVSLTIIMLQLRPFVDLSLGQDGPLPFVARPLELAAIVALVALIFGLARRFPRIPAALAGIVLGTLAFLGAGAVLPEMNLGATIGRMTFPLPPPTPLPDLALPETREALLGALPQVLEFAAVLAALAVLQTLLAYRVAQNLDDVPVQPRRDLVGLGVGTMISSAFGGLMLSGSSIQSVTAYQAGGRTRLVGASVSLLLLGVVALAPGALGAIPVVAISAVVVHIALQTIDPWSVGLLRRLIRRAPQSLGRRDASDLGIVAAVMFVTAGIAILPGVVVGVTLACLLFIVNMSRPLVRRRLDGRTLVSKRIRSLDDAAFLRETGDRRRTLELNGVLFFGNTESLADEVKSLFPVADVIALDCRGVSDVDATGAAILRSLLDRARRQHRTVVLCGAPPAFAPLLAEIARAGRQPEPLDDLDAALEWMEERALAARPVAAGPVAELRLDQHGFVRGLSATELEALAPLLERREFPAGATLAHQGERGDRMWLLLRGSVSIRIETAEPGRGSRRLASLASGTTAGEMALIEGGIRSASIVADEDVSCLELCDTSYDELVARHPGIAARLFGNLLREMVSRLRSSDADLGEAVG